MMKGTFIFQEFESTWEEALNRRRSFMMTFGLLKGEFFHHEEKWMI